VRSIAQRADIPFINSLRKKQMLTNSKMSPRETLKYGISQTELDFILVAMSGKGIIAVFIGSDSRQLHSDLSDAFPGMELVEDKPATEDALAQVAAAINDPRKPIDLPLDMRGSELPMAVWQALRTIPVGETRTYGQIAKMLPVAATAQEVGAACAANVLAVVIPCHRVIKAGGSISGYRWGVARKRRFLQLELAA
jgi:AraC family transcriptional regulator, regulatory protein of adaptative response / methylated-DNA-[protein]-cysteine methyltransferase